MGEDGLSKNVRAIQLIMERIIQLAGQTARASAQGRGIVNMVQIQECQALLKIMRTDEVSDDEEESDEFLHGA